MSFRNIGIATVAGLALLAGISATPASAHWSGERHRYVRFEWSPQFGQYGWYDRDGNYHPYKDSGWYDRYGNYHPYERSVRY